MCISFENLRNAARGANNFCEPRNRAFFRDVSARKRVSNLGAGSVGEIQIRVHRGSRIALLPLFRMADESEIEVQAYYQTGSVLVAREADLVVGLAHIVKEEGVIEIVNLAVVPERRSQGIGKQLIEEAATFSRLSNMRRLIVSTGAWETRNIIFYLNRGFRIFNVVHNFFTSEKGYDLPIRDQVQFEMIL
jgi:N-acetylglutamate synthase-like GNAT family acetyltransferase